MIYREGIEITNILANAVDPSVQASQIQLKCLRQICLLSGYFGRGSVRW